MAQQYLVVNQISNPAHPKSTQPSLSIVIPNNLAPVNTINPGNDKRTNVSTPIIKIQGNSNTQLKLIPIISPNQLVANQLNRNQLPTNITFKAQGSPQLNSPLIVLGVNNQIPLKVQDQNLKTTISGSLQIPNIKTTIGNARVCTNNIHSKTINSVQNLISSPDISLIKNTTQIVKNPIETCNNGLVRLVTPPIFPINSTSQFSNPKTPELVTANPSINIGLGITNSANLVPTNPVIVDNGTLLDKVNRCIKSESVAALKTEHVEIKEEPFPVNEDNIEVVNLNFVEKEIKSETSDDESIVDPQEEDEELFEITDEVPLHFDTEVRDPLNTEENKAEDPLSTEELDKSRNDKAGNSLQEEIIEIDDDEDEKNVVTNNKSADKIDPFQLSLQYVVVKNTDPPVYKQVLCKTSSQGKQLPVQVFGTGKEQNLLKLVTTPFISASSNHKTNMFNIQTKLIPAIGQSNSPTKNKETKVMKLITTPLNRTVPNNNVPKINCTSTAPVNSLSKKMNDVVEKSLEKNTTANDKVSEKKSVQYQYVKVSDNPPLYQRVTYGNGTILQTLLTDNPVSANHKIKEVKKNQNKDEKTVRTLVNGVMTNDEKQMNDLWVKLEEDRQRVSETKEVIVYRCQHCCYSTERKRYMKRHEMMHERRGIHKCMLCNYKARSSNNLDQHLEKSHPGSLPFKCQQCHFRTSRRTSLTSHMIKHKSNRQFFKCDLCDFKTIWKSGLKKHRSALHSREKTFACLLCDYKSYCREGLVGHLRSHSTEKPFACPFCSYRTRSRSTLTVHERQHSGEKPYVCTMCNYRAAQCVSLKMHMKRHQGLFDFPCTVCKYKTIDARSLKVHMRIHRTFTCYHCNYKVRSIRLLRSHIVKRHLKK